MLRSIARFLSPYALFAIWLATGVADPVHAQGFPTPTKTLCVGDPPATLFVPFTCNPTTPTNSPSPGQAVFYAVTLGPGAAAGIFTLLETLAPDFTLLSAKCIVDGTSTTATLTSSVSSATAAQAESQPKRGSQLNRDGWQSDCRGFGPGIWTYFWDTRP